MALEIQVDRSIVRASDVRELSIRRQRGGSDDTAIRQADDYWSKLVKLIPVEVASAYLTLYGIVASGVSKLSLRLALIVLFLAGLIATFYYSKNVLKVQQPAQLWLTCIGFVLWVFATVGFFSTFSWYEPWMASVAVISFGVGVRIAEAGPLA